MKGEWFSVDRKGLAKQLADTPRWRLIAELLSNAWDEKTTRVDVKIDSLPGGFSRVQVIDDNPNGFADLAHAWTLFAPSAKAGTADQRGRFNLGEKLLLAVARRAQIVTTTGMVVFDDSGRTQGKLRSQAGSSVSVELRLTPDTLPALLRLIPPVTTIINGLELESPVEVGRARASLPTVSTDAEGNFVRTTRNTEVIAYSVSANEPSFIYEMGIPVVEVDLPWSLNVMQKVPLNRDRDNVTPSYLQQLRVLALNTFHQVMDPSHFTSNWARAAAGDDDAAPEAVAASLDARFGEKRVAYDPSDPEANRLAVSQGYTVVHGGSLSAGEWQNARPTTAAAGQVTPSPKPFSPDGSPLKTVDFADWTQPMRLRAHLAGVIAQRVGIGSIEVVYTNDPGWGFAGAFGPSHILYLSTVNARKEISGEWPANRIAFLDLLIHEFGHHDGSNHMEARYWNNLTRIGAQVAEFALVNPRAFE